MIKKVIFDVDNTLIMWKDKYLLALKDTVSEYNLDIDYMKINNLIEEYEKYYDKYSKDNLVRLINSKLFLNIDINFVDKWLFRLEKMADYDEEVYNTLKYLSSKYELVILSNWFTDNQIKRLETAKIKDFFSYFVDSSKYIKPSVDSFKCACGNCKFNECIMVGDNFDIDIKPALELGIKSFLISSLDNINSDNLTIIDNISKLKEIL